MRRPRRRRSPSAALDEDRGAAPLHEWSSRFTARRIAVGIAILVSVVVIASRGPVNRTPRSLGAERSFGPHYVGLAGRLAQAGLPTMATAGSSDHFHMQLRVEVDGQSVTVPAGVGADPRSSESSAAVLHTHTSDGLIHQEGQRRATLGQFFAAWGVPFSADRLGELRSSSRRRVQMSVNGRLSRAYGGLVLEDRQRITVTFGPDPSVPGRASVPSKAAGTLHTTLGIGR